ncbi:restriction endonuclease subunit S [Fusobacterium canifelinum]|uniref:restriction endonuclease subunit S n=1 Tax=Fusobacterium canifelinum TaxID=285729 RepID=UPI0030D356FC
MAKNKKVEISLEEKLEKALIPVEEQAYKIPDNWVWTRLGNICEKISKGTTPRGEDGYTEEGVNFLRVENIGDNNSVDLSKVKYINEKTHNGFLKRSILKEKDILISIAGTLGKTAIVKKENLPANINQAISFVRLIDNSKILENFITFYLNSPVTKDNLLSQVKVTAIPNLTLEIISNIKFSLAPLNEQKRIVEKLDFLLEKTKKAKGIIEEIKVDIENRKISILDRAFKGVLTSKWRNKNKVSDVKELLKFINDEKIKKWEEDCLQAEKDGNKKPKKPIIKEVRDMIVPVDEQPYKLPDNWVWVKLGDIIDNIKYGYNASGQETGDVKLLRITDIQNDDVNWSKVPYCKISEEEFKTYQLKVRDILIARTGSVGRTFLIKEIPKDLKLVYASYLIKIYPNKNIKEKYLKRYFNTDLYWKLLKEKSRGIGRLNVNSPSLQALLVPLPPLEEQQEIVRILDEVLENENKVKELLELEERIDILEKSILNKAFKGELGTQNSSDEPAIELLKEIL